MQCHQLLHVVLLRVDLNSQLAFSGLVVALDPEHVFNIDQPCPWVHEASRTFPRTVFDAIDFKGDARFDRYLGTQVDFQVVQRNLEDQPRNLT